MMVAIPIVCLEIFFTAVSVAFDGTTVFVQMQNFFEQVWIYTWFQLLSYLFQISMRTGMGAIGVSYQSWYVESRVE